MDKIKKKRVAEYSAIVIIFALFAILFIKNIHLSTTDDHDKNNQNYHANLSINFDQIYAEQNYKRLKEELKSGDLLPEKHCFADDETISFSENVQPITPLGGLHEAPPEKMLKWQTRAMQVLKNVRVIPQTHKMMNQL